MTPSTKLTAKSRDATPRDGRSREARLAALIRLGRFATGKSSATSDEGRTTAQVDTECKPAARD